MPSEFQLEYLLEDDYHNPKAENLGSRRIYDLSMPDHVQGSSTSQVELREEDSEDERR